MKMKPKTIFYSNQPLPPELFTGRRAEIDALLELGVAPALEGDPNAMFIRGEFGMGKSSTANRVKTLVEQDNLMYGIYANLAGATTLSDLTRVILHATEKTAAKQEAIGLIQAAAVQRLVQAGVPLSNDNLHDHKTDSPPVENATHAALMNYLKKLRTILFAGASQPILLVLDEIDGLAPNRLFAPFVKGLIDTNAQDRDKLSLLLLVCGVRRSWQQMLAAHQSVERIFETIELEPMPIQDVSEFYKKAFGAASISVSQDAIKVFHQQSGGIPRLMHLIGEKAYIADNDRYIDLRDAQQATAKAAVDYGMHVVRRQLADVLESRENRSLLHKLGQVDRQDPRFFIRDITAGLSSAELSNLSPFLDTLVDLNILRHGETRDELEFSLPLVQLYLWLAARQQAPL